MRPDIKTMLASCDTADLFSVLSELLDPSQDGPFSTAYLEDYRYEGYIDKLLPLSQAFHANYAKIKREVEE